MKQGIFNGPDIQNLIKDDNFVNSLNVTESYAWILFVVVVKIFLGNHKTYNYKELVDRMLAYY